MTPTIVTPAEPATPTSPTQRAATGDRQAPWPEHPRQFLERVKETVSKAELGNLLSKGSDPFHLAVLRIHMESFDFRRDPIDLALRKFLLDFHFPKEAQQIDRVLEAFASRYHACNPHLFRSSDVVYTIAFSLMLLHTDAHNKNVRYKMSKEQYVRQAKTIDGVNTIPADILEVLYDNITYLKFVYAEDDTDVDGQRIAEVQSSPSGSWFPRRRTASSQRTDSYSMIRHGSIAHLAPDLRDLIPFRWPYYWKGTIELVDNVQINNQFTMAPQLSIPGLRLRLHNQPLPSPSGHGQFSPPPPLSPTSPTGGSKSFTSSSARPETMFHLDGDLSRVDRDFRREPSIPWSGKGGGGGGGGVGSSGEEDADTAGADGCAQLKIVKSGVLSRKIDIENGKKSTVRGWRELGVILSGSQLLFFTDVGWFQQQRNAQIGFNPQAPPEEDGYFSAEVGDGLPSMPQALVSTLDSIAVVDSSYQKYPHVFRLVCPNGKQYLFRADSEREMNDWMAKINYASAFKTAGVRLRNYRVAWAGDVYWIKDDQGRHQLKRRPRQRDASTGTTSEPIDGRAQLIQAKMKEIDRQINTCAASLAAELRLARGLEVMIPLQNSTRQKIVQSATVVGKRLRHLMLERTKLDCFRTILERDLALVSAPNATFMNVHFRRFTDSGSAIALSAVSTPITDTFSGSTEYSRTSYSSGTVQPQTEMHQQHQHQHQHRHGRDDSDDAQKQQQYQQQFHQQQFHVPQQDTNWGSPTNGAADTAPYSMHHSKEDEYVMDSTRTSQSSNHRTRLNIPELHRSVSESTLEEHNKEYGAKGVDIPVGPMAIQAAIIDAARGLHGVHNGNAISSPDLGHYQGGLASPSMQPPQYQQQQQQQQHQQSGSPKRSKAPASPLSGQSMLSPESSGSQTTTRSRALSMPGQRPTMPRTVSIYSSSSQTANRLRRIFEQGLVHFKFSSHHHSHPPPLPTSSTLSTASSSSSTSIDGAVAAVGMALAGSTLKTSFSMDQDDIHDDPDVA
ncbi:hypothetical protein BGZ98_001440 [Dissophora globulifera]|nr:hypothetical protein BGZ98_001440 [Dissophora globulifera]